MSELALESSLPGNIAYKPNHQTAFGIKRVVFKGETIIVHDTNNFSFFIIAFGIRASGEPLHWVDKMYLDTLEQKESELGRVGLFEEFGRKYPELWAAVVTKELEGAVLLRSLSDTALSVEQHQANLNAYEQWKSEYGDRDLRILACSIIYDGLVDMLPPHADPAFLYT